LSRNKNLALNLNQKINATRQFDKSIVIVELHERMEIKMALKAN